MIWTVANQKLAWNPWRKPMQIPTPQQMAQGKMCRFHPNRPAVIATGFAPMCSDCLHRYEQALPGPLPHDELVDFLGKRAKAPDSDNQNNADSWSISHTVSQTEASWDLNSESCPPADQTDQESPANSGKTSSWLITSDTLPSGIPLHEHACGQGFLNNGWVGWTPISMMPGGQIQYGQRTHDCPTCGARLDRDPPMPVGPAPRMAAENPWWHPDNGEFEWYHAAPTTERARIKTWGLQPSKPSRNKLWGQADLESQPEGVYMTDYDELPQSMGTTPEGYPVERDVWKVDPSYFQELKQDEMWPSSYVAPHEIPPEALTLHEGPEHLWQKPDVDKQQVMPAKWLINANPEWGIGRPDRVIGKTADNYTLDSREWPDPTEPRPSKPPAQKGCTCQWGDKLNCPVHGLNADPELADLDHSWSLPENSPVGYPQDQPRGWTGPYQSSFWPLW